MPEILSQSQIDALLKGIDSGEVNATTPEQEHAKKVKEYDFKSPKKFTKEQLRTLDSLHENFSRILSSYLTSVLRVFCEVSVETIEEQRYSEFNNALPDSALIGLIDMIPASPTIEDTSLIADLSKQIGFFMIDRLLGGTGENFKLDRDFTEIEVAILEHIFKKIASMMQESWSTHIDVNTELASIETNARLIQTLSPDDIVVIIVLDIKIRKLTGNFSICIPAISLENMINNLNVKNIKMAKKIDIEKENMRRNHIVTTLTNSDLELKAILHEMEMELSDVLNLQVDDVILLDKNINSDVRITVNDNPWFTAKAGVNKHKKAIKINTIM